MPSGRWWSLGTSHTQTLIVPDSSAWVEYFRRTESRVHRRLAQALQAREHIANVLHNDVDFERLARHTALEVVET